MTSCWNYSMEVGYFLMPGWLRITHKLNPTVKCNFFDFTSVDMDNYKLRTPSLPTLSRYFFTETTFTVPGAQQRMEAFLLGMRDATCHWNSELQYHAGCGRRCTFSLVGVYASLRYVFTCVFTVPDFCFYFFFIFLIFTDMRWGSWSFNRKLIKIYHLLLWSSCIINNK